MIHADIGVFCQRFMLVGMPVLAARLLLMVVNSVVHA